MSKELYYEDFEMDKIAECGGIIEPCGATTCPVCARFYRLWLNQGVRNISGELEGSPLFVTLELARAPLVGLRDSSLFKLRDMLRMRLNRAGVKGSVAIGGVEAKLHRTGDKWIIHAHLLMFRVPQNLQRTLNKKLSRGASRDVVTRTVSDLREFGSYLQKFETGYRPGRRFGSSRPRMVPMSPAALESYLQWLDAYEFRDFLFLYGCRLRGRKIQLE